MTSIRVTALTEEILRLPDTERAALAEAVLPTLVTTPAGLASLDEALGALPEDDLARVIERARGRQPALTDATVAAVIGEALRAVRATRRP